MEKQLNKKPILIVSNNDSGQRVDNYLFKHRKQLDKSTCYKLMRKGQIRVNGKRIKPTQKVRAGDEVRMPPFVFFVEQNEIIVSTARQNELLRHAIFENDDYLVLNKPEGLPVHKGTGHELGAIEIINSLAQYKEVQLAHRLDKETSGCLLMAKNRQALLSFQNAMQKNAVTKTYFSILEGILSDSIIVDERLDTENRVNGFRYVVVSEQGKPATTEFIPVKSCAQFTLVQCQITHGRTHQIRVHAQWINHPVLGDKIYGNKRTDFSRQLFLHATSLSFEAYEFNAPLPPSFEALLA